jgi:D-alanyl-D-alanine dipeptidase
MLLLLALGAASPLVDAKDYVPDLVVDLRYATEENFLHKAVYPKGSRCLMLKDSAELLKAAADALAKKGFRLKVWDCYRPFAVQQEMWRIFPKRGYVADPGNGGSNHNRGGAVDLTLITKDGTDVEMPTEFDTFARAAFHSYKGGSELSRKNRQTLRDAMEAAGFVKNPMEWWHWELPDAIHHPVLDEPLTAP